MTKVYQPGQSFVITGPKVYHSSKKDEYETPDALYQRLDEEFEFQLDPCASAPSMTTVPMKVTVWDWSTEPPAPMGPAALPVMLPGNGKCPVSFTPSDNGLSQHWFGRVFMNPPYSAVGQWIQKLLHELLTGRIELGVALVAARVDTQWFQVVASYAAEIRFLKGRLTFKGEPHPAPFPSCVLVFDPTRAVQAIKFWDWQTGTAPVYWKAPGYSFVPGKPGKPGLALPKPTPLTLVKAQ